MQIELRAKMFADAAHRAVGQLRKYTDYPYITHCQNVVMILIDCVPPDDWYATNDKGEVHKGDFEFLLAAGYLHDVLEDTQVDYDTLRQYFGDKVANLVLEVTDVSKPGDGNRAVRKHIDLLHLAEASPLGKTLKLADLIDNAKDIQQNDPKFAKVYMAEKRALLQVLKEGDQVLWNMANKIVEDYYASEHTASIVNGVRLK